MAKPTRHKLTSTNKPGGNSRRRDGVICLGLVIITWLVFAQTLGHDFVNYDDRVYVVQNAQVNGGLSFSAMAWAFTHSHANNWHPLTTISHMLDCQLFDLKPAGHHFVNVLWHMFAVLLLFLVLREMTGAVWPSAFVAAVFAIHPLRVESVAWIAERKDVLSAVFFLLTLGAYFRYARKPSTGRYLIMSILFACGLMSKPMLVTVPFVLLLLDYWPLNRLVDLRSLGKMVREKIPLWAMSLALGVVTFVIQEHSTGSIAQLPLAWRIENALVSYVVYIRQMFWPLHLAVFYPHPENHLALWQLALAAIFLIAITAFAFRLRQTKKYLLTGWLWYLSMLLPVVGLVEVGLQGHADRYTYLPQIGLYIAITWLIVDLTSGLRYRRELLGAVASLLIAALSALAWKQTSYWRNSETLWTHTLALTPDSDVAHTNIGTLLMERGQLDEALAQFQTALTIRSGSTHAHYDLSLALIHNDLGNVLLRKGSVDEAFMHWHKAVEFQPGLADAHYNMGSAYFQKGETDAAIVEYEKALSLRPNDSEAETSLGNAFVRKGSLGEAIAHYQIALKLTPSSVLPLNNLAWISSTSPDPSFRNGEIAVGFAQKADQYSERKNPVFIRTLAAAYAEAGRFEDAIENAERAAQVARAQGDVDLAREIERDVDLYRARTPLRDPSLTSGR